jgi:thiamine transporter
MVARMHLKEELDTNYFLLLGLFALLIVYALSALITSLISQKAFKITNLIGLGLSIAYGIVLVCVLPSVYQPLSAVGMYVFSAVLVIGIALLTIFTGKYTGTASKTKTIAYASVCIALSYALSFIKFFTVGANGGSVTFASLLPLMIFSYCFGCKKGVFAGVIYGVLQFLQSPQMYQGMQVLLDYPIAFGTIGIAGMFKNAKFTKHEFVKFALGAIIAVTLRYIAHVLSGYYVFNSWAWEGYSAIGYSLVYNIYCFVDLAIVLIPAFGIFASKSVMNELKKMSN